MEEVNKELMVDFMIELLGDGLVSAALRPGMQAWIDAKPVSVELNVPEDFVEFVDQLKSLASGLENLLENFLLNCICMYLTGKATELLTPEGEQRRTEQIKLAMKLAKNMSAKGGDVVEEGKL